MEIMKPKTIKTDLEKDMVGAIVLGGNFLGLGIVRSLGRRGIPVWVVDTSESTSIAQHSRYTKRFIVSQEPIETLLLREGRKHQLNGWVVFPGNDEYVDSISANHKSLSAIFRLITPPVEVTKFALDKRLTYSRADELGIAAPRTSVNKTMADFEVNEFPYPLILKPAMNHHFFPHTNLKAIPVSNAEELQRAYAQMSRYIPMEEILVQERIPGGGENQFSFCALCKEGRVIASLVAQRRRQYPIEFGNASTFVQTTTQPDVEAAGRRFMEALEYDGMGEIEFKFDPRDGKYKILDANLRPWGWHTLGKAAGIDFSYLLWRQKLGLPISTIATQNQASWVREITDVVAIAKSKNRGAELKGLLKAIRSGHFTLATFDFMDPIPFFTEIAKWVSSGLSRQRKAKKVFALGTADSQP
jgi:D-aspartate ligase